MHCSILMPEQNVKVVARRKQNDPSFGDRSLMISKKIRPRQP
jgi:hypothetical protein